jgi:stage II sporulation protein D
MKKKILRGIVLCVLILFLPYIITMSMTGKLLEEEETEAESGYTVILSENGAEKKVDMEEYIVGVLAGEMPVSYEEETLKAQAVAIRTYTLKKFGDNKEAKADEIGQSYLSEEDLETRWGYDTFVKNYAKLRQIVFDTRGEVIKYDGNLIEAVYHSASTGVTRSADKAWNTDEMPYLVSVESRRDVEAEGYLQSVEYSKEETVAKIKETYADYDGTAENLCENLLVMEREEGDYVTSIQAGNKVLTGEEFRKVLGLASCAFTIEENGDMIKITCKGIGHGVGMSQFGANILAKSGKNYREILAHYYSDITVEALY